MIESVDPAVARALSEEALDAPDPSQTSPELDRDELLANARLASEFLKALSHEARLVILCLLADGEKSVTELERMLDLRQPAVSQQLARLRADDLVETRREGRNVFYSLSRPEVKAVIEALHAAFCAPKMPRN
jgi:DNA-binding transcriptional ArsR family regulator